MKDIEYVILKKEDFDSFISRLSKFRKLAAPVSKGYNNYSFKEVTSADEIAVKYIPTILPPKKFFMPQQEFLLEFNTAKGLDTKPVVEYEKIMLFGVHTCDLAGIQCLNMVFSVRPRDYNYLIRKRQIDIIGIECNEYCDEYASCCLVSAHMPSGGYDMFFTDLGDYFVVHVNTQVGENIVESIKFFEQARTVHLEELKEMRDRKRRIFKNEVSTDPRFIPDMFDRSFDSNVWKELEERCLACGNCTNVCPTCYCFDIMDDMNMDMKTGGRFRKWDSCQLEPFAKVAGGENFRKERSARQRHRYYRKFRYPVSKFARFFCTGCGRCSRTCMAKINLKETLNALLKERDESIWKKVL
ncbi:MAG: Anaerobic sulfite reductase subunit A [Syntrophomonadaceae bacterium]|nr:Anaerobic sulfite reductase subunit A [Bacillota bacterium]